MLIHDNASSSPLINEAKTGTDPVEITIQFANDSSVIHVSSYSYHTWYLVKHGEDGIHS